MFKCTYQVSDTPDAQYGTCLTRMLSKRKVNGWDSDFLALPLQLLYIQFLYNFTDIIKL